MSLIFVNFGRDTLVQLQSNFVYLFIFDSTRINPGTSFEYTIVLSIETTVKDFKVVKDTLLPQKGSNPTKSG